jgi:hypothetical protein
MSAPTDEVRHEPGIYFQMPDEVYHSDPALGSTRLKAIAVDPYEAQFDHLYGEDKDTDALIFGSALHKRMLEGREAFLAGYCSAFDPSTCAGALRTVSDLTTWLAQHGQDSGLSKLKKDGLIKLALDIDPDVQIEDVIRQRWEEQNAGKIALPAKRWAQIEVASRWVQRDPLLSAVMEDGTFKDGAPEVSVFYEDRGVRLKCRFDRLLRHAIVDLKTFAPFFLTGALESAVVKVLERMRYDLQAAAYLRGWQRARDLFAAGKVFGEEPFPGFLEQCFDRPEPAWIWIMVKTKGAPQPLVVDWKAKSARAAAADMVEHAIDRFIELRDRHGERAEWPPERQAFTITDADLPAWWGRN